MSLSVFCATCPGLMMARSVDELPVYLWVAGCSLVILQRFGVEEVLVAL